MSHNLELAQKHAWSLARTLMITVILFKSDNEYGVLPADEIEDAEALCALAASVGASCEACTSDGEIVCLSIEVDQITATAVDGLTLETITASDCHEQCSDNADDCDLGGADTGGL